MSESSCIAFCLESRGVVEIVEVVRVVAAVRVLRDGELQEPGGGVGGGGPQLASLAGERREAGERCQGAEPRGRARGEYVGRRLTHTPEGSVAAPRGGAERTR